MANRLLHSILSVVAGGFWTVVLLFVMIWPASYFHPAYVAVAVYMFAFAFVLLVIALAQFAARTRPPKRKE